MPRSRSLRAFYTFVFFWAFNPTRGLWILYLLHCRWSLLQVGFAEAGFHVVSFLSEVPTGIYADHRGRRKSLGVGLITQIVTTAATLVAAPKSVFLGCVSISFSALAWAFISGADQALLFDIVSQELRETSFGRVYGSVLALNLAVGASSTALGGWLATRCGWTLPYAITVGSALCGLVPIYFLPGVKVREGVPLRTGMAESLGIALRTAREIPGLRLWIGFGAGLATLVTINNLYAQSTLVLKGATLETTSLLVAFSGIATALGSWLGGHLGGRRPVRLLSAGTAWLAMAVAAVGVLPLPESGVGYLTAAGIDGALDPVYQSALNQVAPEAQRATILSLPGAGFSLGMIVLFPLAGWGMSAHHLKLVYGLLGMGLLFVALGLMRGRREQIIALNE